MISCIQVPKHATMQVISSHIKVWTLQFCGWQSTLSCLHEGTGPQCSLSSLFYCHWCSWWERSWISFAAVCKTISHKQFSLIHVLMFHIVAAQSAAASQNVSRVSRIQTMQPTRGPHCVNGLHKIMIIAHDEWDSCSQGAIFSACRVEQTASCTKVGCPFNSSCWGRSTRIALYWYVCTTNSPERLSSRHNQIKLLETHQSTVRSLSDW